MRKFIYPLCALAAFLIQMFLRKLLQDGTLTAIPGDFLIYLVAWLIAKKWTQYYDKKNS